MKCWGFFPSHSALFHSLIFKLYHINNHKNLCLFIYVNNFPFEKCWTKLWNKENILEKVLEGLEKKEQAVPSIPRCHQVLCKVTGTVVGFTGILLNRYSPVQVQSSTGTVQNRYSPVQVLYCHTSNAAMSVTNCRVRQAAPQHSQQNWPNSV